MFIIILIFRIVTAEAETFPVVIPPIKFPNSSSSPSMTLSMISTNSSTRISLEKDTIPMDVPLRPLFTCPTSGPITPKFKIYTPMATRWPLTPWPTASGPTSTRRPGPTRSLERPRSWSGSVESTQLISRQIRKLEFLGKLLFFIILLANCSGVFRKVIWI